MDNKLKQALAHVQKPGRYVGAEAGCCYKDKKDVELRFAFCFPDTYEVGMSFLGMKVLYEILNAMDGVWCERAFMPWVDMLEEMRQRDIPLYALESMDPLRDFDVVGFTLQYELSYSNVLAMLDLAGIPLRAAERGEEHPLIIAGGPCAVNAEPMADFFDYIFLGEAEEVMPRIFEHIKAAKKAKTPRAQLLKELAQFEGVYVPSLYDVAYREDGTVAAITPKDGAPARVRKAIIRDFAAMPPPEHFVVPMVGAIHDRAMLEIMRGCARGCRFCQAGFTYRPARERDAAELNASGRRLCEHTGYDEISLTSLSTSDHSGLEPLLDDMLKWTNESHVSISLPSLRVDNFTEGLAAKTTQIRKSGLTFAPEAGTQRLRDVINKNVTQEEIDRTCLMAFDAGYTGVKLYFMMGLPTETMEDIEGIAQTAQRVVDLFYANPNRRKGQGVTVTVSVSCFVPKPMTPFEVCGQDAMETLREKQQHLLRSVRSKKIRVKYHDSKTSFLEAVFARGDRRLSAVLEHAYRNGCVFDSWDDQFRYGTWMEAFVQAGLDPHFYANRTLEADELLPWSIFDYGVDARFLRAEFERALAVQMTPACREHCAGCGVSRLYGGECFG